jgi:S-formylglutathione hydrolase
MKCPWGKKCFEGYLQGGVAEAKEKYDATELISRHKDPVHILVDYVGTIVPFCFTWSINDLRAGQGTGDQFYQDGQLLPENFLKAARDGGYDEVQVRVRSQPGYDHSYYFVRALLTILVIFRSVDLRK